ncbi:MAG: DUF4386 domain-containing protein [Candidatus Dormibacteria bacterium]
MAIATAVHQSRPVGIVTSTSSRRERRTARVVGVLLITATVTVLLSEAVLAPLLKSPLALNTINASATQLAMGALLQVLAAAACAGIAIGLYPVLEKHNRALALGAVAFRTIEAAMYVVGVVGLLALLTLSQEYVTAAPARASVLQTIAALTPAARNWTSLMAVLAFGLGASLYYCVFYQSRLIPRWLSVWGLVGAALAIVASVLVLFGVIGYLSTVQVVVSLPIAVQEMVLAVWLIARGFSMSAAPGES